MTLMEIKSRSVFHDLLKWEKHLVIFLTLKKQVLSITGILADNQQIKLPLCDFSFLCMPEIDHDSSIL